MRHPTFPKLAAIFARVGLVTFGGGDPTAAALHAELVARRAWLAPERFGMAFALARITPGTNILALCAGAAWQILGFVAAAAAVLAATVPSAALVVLFTAGYEWMKTNPVARSAIAALLAAAVGLMAAAAWQLLEPHMRGRRRASRAAVIFAGALALALGLGLPPIPVLGLGAAAGFFWEAPADA